ncbi:MAG: hypothetical protein K0Q60_4926, partial [Microvirga sp.]|nr:hypothetical protein [Microvirga sp.]
MMPSDPEEFVQATAAEHQRRRFAEEPFGDDRLDVRVSRDDRCRLLPLGAGGTGAYATERSLALRPSSRRRRPSKRSWDQG